MNIIETYGYPPEDCRALKQWLWQVVTELAAANPIKCSTDTTDPTAQDLTDLWSPCDVPEGAFVTWYNSVSTDTLYYAYYSGAWTELTL